MIIIIIILIKTSRRIWSVSSKFLLKMSDVSVPFLGQELTPVSSAKDQGVMRALNLTFNEHFSSPSLLPFIYP